MSCWSWLTAPVPAGQSPFIVHYAAGLAGRGLDVVTFDFAYLSRGRKTPDHAAGPRRQLSGPP